MRVLGMQWDQWNGIICSFLKINLYSVQPKVSIRVDGATELGTKISQSEAATANVRVMPEPAGTQVCR